jgi:hypothetical protein
LEDKLGFRLNGAKLRAFCNPETPFSARVDYVDADFYKLNKTTLGEILEKVSSLQKHFRKIAAERQVRNKK